MMRNEASAVTRKSVGHENFLRLFRAGKIRFAGHRKLRVYGTLRCRSGKRMKREHRVFFATAADAMNAGFRPCGNCMREAYRLWKSSAEKGKHPVEGSLSA